MRPAAALVPLAVLIAAVTGGALYALSRPVPPLPEPRVRLAVLVVFDQMRGDFLARWQPLFGPDGFVRLQRDGAWFTDCHYPYAVTTTGPGHASMLTGACPDKHGIVDNNWIEGGKGVYCAGSPKYRRVPDPDEGKAPLGEPRDAGTPERLLSETVADVLKRETRGRAKVFGVSLKDRSAILPTGQRPDGAFWFYAGVFGTSSYYTNYNGDLPLWVERFNASKVANRWFGENWDRDRSRALYNVAVGPDDPAGKGKGVNQGVSFPHPLTGEKPTAKKPAPYSKYDALANSPFGNDLLLEFTKTCVIEERLGLHDVPDLLVVSFSSNDLIGHTWGPDSHEVLDVTLRSDALVAELLAFLDARVGTGRYVLGLTADHGVCPLPEVTSKKWYAEGRADWQEARRVDPVALRKALDAYLAARFIVGPPTGGKTPEWVELPFPWVHLKPNALLASGVPREQFAAEAAKFLATQKGVARTFTAADLMGSVPASDEVANRMKRSFYPARCGDVGIVLNPYCIPQLGPGTTHGSPYEYDTHVPLIVYGPGIRGGPRDEPTTPQALASIFAAALNIPRPKDAAFPIPTTLK